MARSAPSLEGGCIGYHRFSETVTLLHCPDFVHYVGKYDVIRYPITERSKIDFLKLNGNDWLPIWTILNGSVAERSKAAA